MGRKPIQIVAETTTDGPAVITAGPVALIGRSVDIKQGYRTTSVLVSEVSNKKGGRDTAIGVLSRGRASDRRGANDVL